MAEAQSGFTIAELAAALGAEALGAAARAKLEADFDPIVVARQTADFISAILDKG